MFVFLVDVNIALSTAYCNVNINKKNDTCYCNIASNVYY